MQYFLWERRNVLARFPERLHLAEYLVKSVYCSSSDPDQISDADETLILDFGIRFWFCDVPLRCLCRRSPVRIRYIILHEPQMDVPGTLILVSRYFRASGGDRSCSGPVVRISHRK